jgi:MoxR-like ATPase
MLSDRDFVVPDDVLRLAPTVLGHRVVLSNQTIASGATGEQVVSSLLARLPRARR